MVWIRLFKRPHVGLPYTLHSSAKIQTSGKTHLSATFSGTLVCVLHGIWVKFSGTVLHGRVGKIQARFSACCLNQCRAITHVLLWCLPMSRLSSSKLHFAKFENSSIACLYCTLQILIMISFHSALLLDNSILIRAKQTVIALTRLIKQEICGNGTGRQCSA